MPEQTASRPSVGLVTTWAEPCGISTYSEQLAPVLRRAGVPVHVLSTISREARIRLVPDFDHAPSWVARSAAASAGNADTLRRAVEQKRLGVVHFQHEDGLWPDSAGFIRTCRACKQAGARVIVTLHTVFDYGSFLGRTGFYDALRSVVDTVVVHTAAAQAAVSCARGLAPVLLIPHGTPEQTPGTRTRGLELLGVDDGSVVGLVFGFIGSGKNTAMTVLAFGAACAQRLCASSKTTLVILGENTDPLYVTQSLRPAIAATGYGPCIKLIERFTMPDDVPHIMAAADFAVLNSQSHNLSASGQVHQHAAHGVPLAVADRPIYTDAIRAGAIPFRVNEESRPDHPTQSAINAIGALASSKQLRSVVGNRLYRATRKTTWAKLVPTYLMLYAGEIKDAAPLLGW
jgi:glycosyltransferase involved in cell wall biosynthesis